MPNLDPDALAPLDTEELMPLGEDDLLPLGDDALTALDDEPVDAAVAVDLSAAVEAAVASAEDAEEDIPAPEPEPEPVPVEPEPIAPEPIAPDPEPIAPEPEPIAPEPAPEPVAAAPEAPPKKKPAKLKLSYKNPKSVVREYTENLRKGGSFIKTAKPLPVGRAVIIEVRVPAIADDPIVIPGMVTWSSRDMADLGPAEVPGMGIEYSLDDAARAALEARLEGL